MTSRRTFCSLVAVQALLTAAGNKVRVGCQTRSYGMPPKDVTSLLPLLEDMRAAGYEGFETNHVILQSAGAASLKRELEKRTPLIGLHLGLRFDRSDDNNLSELARVANGIRTLGGTHIMLSGTALRGVDPSGVQDAFRRKADLLTRGAKVCREAGVRLCVHNHQEETRDNFAEFVFIAAHTRPEDVFFLLDVGHAALAKADAPAFVRKYASRIAGFHVKDWEGNRQVPMGTGQVDLMGLAKAIRDTNWSGWLIAELEGERIPGVTDEQNVRAARKFIREQMKV